MSFMFNPYPYNDANALNKPELSKQAAGAVVAGVNQVAERLLDEVSKQLSGNDSGLTIAMDGYATADWTQAVNLLNGKLTKENISCRVFNVADFYKSSQALDKMLAPNLPNDREKDPVLLFGKLFEQGYESLFDKDKLNEFKQELKNINRNTVNIVYGAGACAEAILPHRDITVYFDITPKEAVLRVKNGKYINLGDECARPFKETMRRCYYFDFEIAMCLRMSLLKEDSIDFYIAGDNPENLKLVPKKAFNEICSSLTNYPFRCKPVYLEGVWGGHYIKKLRHLPDEMKNCAWVFDLIPLEVSLLIAAGTEVIEIPFFTFVCKEGKSLMGQQCVDTFKGYFPIRFNYDDSYHSNGNMSIQLHPQSEYCKENFNEFGRQDESYYIVATGHGAKTYVGLNDDCSAEEFIDKVKQSEIDFSPIDYEKYINYFDSVPGMQFMLPGGTIHSSGRNQLILEIGSLTVGSYTFKMYDYLREDFDGVPRPIHSCHGEKVLDTSLTAAKVAETLIHEPRILRSGSNWAEYIVGEHDSLYFNLFRYEFEEKIEGNTNGVFHVLSLIDGEKVAVYPKGHPERRYVQNYLDIVVVPASTGEYVIENLGNQPVCVHKTCLKENFVEYV